MIALLLLALTAPRTALHVRPGGPPSASIQARIPTVGDTIWLTRRVIAPPGAEVRAPAWTPEEGLALLGRPVIRIEGGATLVSWPAVAWSAGTRTVSVPGPVVIRADGVTDSLPAESQTLEVASVLPDSTPIEKIPPQPEAGIVLERITSPWPVLVATLAALLIIAPLAWWWRRRGPAGNAALATLHPPVWPLSEWSESGEGRAVAAVAARNLRTTLVRLLPGTPPGLVTSRLIRIMREQRPAWPIADLSRVLEALEAVQFSATTPAAVLALASEAEELRLAVESLGVKAASGAGT